MVSIFNMYILDTNLYFSSYQRITVSCSPIILDIILDIYYSYRS